MNEEDNNRKNVDKIKGIKGFWVMIKFLKLIWWINWLREKSFYIWKIYVFILYLKDFCIYLIRKNYLVDKKELLILIENKKMIKKKR